VHPTTAITSSPFNDLPDELYAKHYSARCMMGEQITRKESAGNEKH
jgi:hypothetical protein